jgi:hypothetical protein
MAGVAFAVKGDGVGFATESYAVSALYTTLANLSADLWRIRRAKLPLGVVLEKFEIFFQFLELSPQRGVFGLFLQGRCDLEIARQ